MKITKVTKDKQWIGVDLDGTLAKYDQFLGASHIGEPIPKMLTRVKRWIENGKTVKIFTARAANKGKDKDEAINAIKAWSKKHIGCELEITCTKDRYMTELWDDRAIQVKKNEGVRVASGMLDRC